MFENMKKRVKGWMQRAGAETQISREFKDIFELGGVPAFNQFYYYGIFVWKWIYKGFYKPWHFVKAPTILNPYGRRELARMDMAKAVCSELAGLIWSEQCDIAVSQEGQERQVLDEYVHDVLAKNGFWTKMQESVEQAMALGGCAIKVWYEEERDKDGTPIPGRGGIRLGFCMADQFVPTAWDNAKVKNGVFISREAKDGYYYTRLEWHKWDGLTYYVSNELFRAEQNQMHESQDILGFRYPLNVIYPFLNEETELKGLTTSLFTYFRTAIANNIDDNSPLGVSIYANALSTLRSLDICYDSFIREFQLGKKRIIVPAQALRTVRDPITGNFVRYFDADDEALVGLATDDANALQIHDNSVALRVDEHISAINAFLSTLCLQLGFSAGTFTFDQAQGLKTATEVISENSKTYKTIKGHQQQIKMALDDLVTSIIQLAALYDVEYKGYKISALADIGWESKVTFDDSILQDRQTNINEGVLLTNSGLMSKKRFLVEKLGYTEEEAEQELEEIRKESGVGVLDVDLSQFVQNEALNPNTEPEAQEEDEEAAEDES